MGFEQHMTLPSPPLVTTTSAPHVSHFNRLPAWFATPATYRRCRMWMMQTEPAPIMWAMPTRAPSTWRSPA